MNLVLPLDHGLSAAFKMAGDPRGGNYELAGNAADADMIAEDHTRGGYLDLGDLYARWDRINSFYEPKSIDGVTGTDAAVPQAIRDDSPSLRSHVKRRLMALSSAAREAELRVDGYICTSWMPGTAVKDLVPTGGGASFPVRGMITGVKWFAHAGPEDYTGEHLIMRAS